MVCRWGYLLRIGIWICMHMGYGKGEEFAHTKKKRGRSAQLRRWCGLQVTSSDIVMRKGSCLI